MGITSSKKIGQSALEYTLILAAIVSAVLAAGTFLKWRAWHLIAQPKATLGRSGIKIYDRVGSNYIGE